SGTIAGSTAINTSGNINTSGTIQATGSISTNDALSSNSLTTREINLFDSDDSNFIRLQPPATGDLVGDFTFTLPIDDGTPNQVLATDRDGVLSWTAPTGATLTTLNGETGAVQTCATPDFNGTAPYWDSDTDVH